MHTSQTVIGSFVISVAIALFLSVGCQHDPAADSTVVIVREGVTPMLAADRDDQITLFGGLPQRLDSGYRGRSRGAFMQHSFAGEGGDFDCHLDREGRRLVFASTRHSEQPDLYMKSVDGTAVVQLTSDPSSDVQPAFSPDNQRVAFASNRTGNWDIWVIGLDGQQPVQVTNSPMHEVHPSWSPDGTQLVFCALPPTSGQWELWIAPAQEHATSTFIGYGVFPEWSPVDDTIVYQRARQRGSEWFSVWTIKLVDGEPRYPTEIASSPEFALVTPTMSRDGRYVAYASIPGMSDVDPAYGGTFQQADIWVVGVDEGARVRLTDGHTANFSPAWSPDGRVFFTSTRSGHENIWSVMPSMGSSMMTSPADTADRGPVDRHAVTTRAVSSDGS